ncbi:MAG: protein-disulfide reductase DsbD [Pseudomonadota bacterium]
MRSDTRAYLRCTSLAWTPFTTAKRRIIQSWLLLFVACLPLISLAADEFLEPEQAFKFSARMLDAKTITVTYVIADGYYMYRERFKFTANGAGIDAPKMPQGAIKFDDTFQKEVETYRGTVEFNVPVTANGAFTLSVISQGCADQGLCYAPMSSVKQLSPQPVSGLQAAIAAARADGAVAENTPASSENISSSQVNAAQYSINPTLAEPKTESGSIEAALSGGKLHIILPLFLLLGLGLAFTPCVLPMVPILSAILVGEGRKASRLQSIIISLTYVLGMALVYTGLGIAAGLLGEGLSAALQNPWMLGSFSVLMVALALSMFGVYHLQVPALIQSKLVRVSDAQQAGKLIGAFVMGALSALIVGPCVAAPLAGALVYISQTRDVVIGGSALFALALGMGLPLLMVGVSAGSLLPRAGRWMESVKIFFGVLLLGMALWLVTPLTPVWLQMLGWAVLAIGYGAYLLRAQQSSIWTKACAAFFLLIGLAELAGAFTGAQEVLAPWSGITGTSRQAIVFQHIKNVEQLDAALLRADGKIVMLDFYADWCVACKEMEKFTFNDARIREKFKGILLLQADVTANDSSDKALLKRFHLFGPPGILFFDPQGQEISSARVIGYQKADKFLQVLDLLR